MITSVGNPVIRRVIRLRKRMWRERTGRVLVEGHRAVRSALSAGDVEMVLHTPTATRLRADVLDEARGARVRVHEIGPAVMSYLASATTAPDVLAVAPMPTRAMTGPASAVSGLILAGIHDPATLGSMIATGASLQASTIVVGQECTDVFAPKCVRAAHGAHFGASVIRTPDVRAAVGAFRDAGSRVVSLASEGVPPWDMALDGPMMLLVAPDEAELSAMADHVVSVPAIGSPPSLSAQVAMVLYEWVRQGGAQA